MERVLASFVHALRNSDVRVSTAETLDAMRVLQLVGYHDRAALHDALALTLSKTIDEKRIFDRQFERFFFSDGEAAETGSHETTALDMGQAPDLAPASSELGALLMSNSVSEVSLHIAAAAQRVHVHQITVFTQKNVYTRRIMNDMGLADLQTEVDRLQASSALSDRALAAELLRRRDQLRERVRDHVERQFLLHAAANDRHVLEEVYSKVRLSNLDQRNHRRIQELVVRMARKLVALHSRRRKVFKRGKLHIQRTLRHNMSYDGAIFDLRWKSVKIDRPKVFAICDVSGSVAAYSRFMLTFLYSLEEVLQKIRSFAFSSELGEVSDLFDHHSLEDAIGLTLRQYGGGSTSYGQALLDFRRRCLTEIDNRSTVIILGDARNNHGDAQVEVLKEIFTRCRRLIWLNPEPPGFWGTGDSEMRRYATYCHEVAECNSLHHLERVISRLLRMQG
jgi:uncharacterized protein with von Willebrand factor type A (vWA) domain